MSFGKSLGEFIQSIINSKSDPAAKAYRQGEKAFKQKTEESAFVWLESDHHHKPSTGGKGGYYIRQQHIKFTRSLANSDEETQRKFVLMTLPENIKGDKGDYCRGDYAANGFIGAEDCSVAIMKQFQELKEEYERKGLGIKIKDLSPFLTDAYLDLYNIESWKEIFN